MVKIPWFKRRYLINSRFQLEITGYLILIQAIALTAIGALTLHASQTLVQTAAHSAYFGQQVPLLVQEFNASLVRRFVIFGGLSLLFGVLGGILISQRAAGPIYRLRELLRAIGDETQVDPIDFRKDDYFRELLPELRKIASMTPNRKAGKDIS